MLPIVLSEVERAVVFIGWPLITIIFIILCILVYEDITTVTYIDDDGTEHHRYDNPENIYDTLMERDKHRFLKLPKLFKRLNKYGELRVGEHMMKKVRKNEYEDEQGNHWNIHHFTRHDPNSAAYPYHWVVTRHNASRGQITTHFKPLPFRLGFYY